MRNHKIRIVVRHTLWLSLLAHFVLLLFFSVNLSKKQPLPATNPAPALPSYLAQNPPQAPSAPPSAPATQQTAAKKPVKKVEKEGIKKKVQKAKVNKPNKAKEKVISTAKKVSKPVIKPRQVKFSQNMIPEDITSPHDQEPMRLIGETRIIKPLVKILARALSQTLRYPRVAADFNLRGVVLVGFVLDPDGYVTQTKIVKSSGAGVLDDAARDAVGAMSPVGDVHAYLNKPEFLVVGIIFG